MTHSAMLTIPIILAIPILNFVISMKAEWMLDARGRTSRRPVVAVGGVI